MANSDSEPMMLRYWNLISFLLLFFVSISAHATWKPEYAKNPQSVQMWFQLQKMNPAVSIRLGYGSDAFCCDHADRLMTKFVGGPVNEWSYYSDPNCTHKDCPLKQIPNDAIHTEEIHALNPLDDNLPEFAAMRREGVLMIYEGRVTCFWPPQPSI